MSILIAGLVVFLVSHSIGLAAPDWRARQLARIGERRRKVNGQLHDVVLFGAFLVWALVTFVIRRGRDRRAGTTYPAGNLAKDAIALVAGVAVSLGFALFLHGPLIGVRPFG